MQNVRSILEGEVISLPPHASVREAARLMREKNVGTVIIQDASGRLRGVVTDRDLACGVLGSDPNPDPDAAVSQVMTQDPLSIEASCPVRVAADLMANRGIRRIPVVETDGNGIVRCVGIVSFEDLVLSEEIESGQIRDMIRKQLGRPEPPRPVDLSQVRRKAQTKDVFLREIGRRTELSKPMALTFSLIVLRLLIRRVKHTEAAHLITQLPEDLQDLLWDVKAGPDRNITSQRMLSDVARELRIGLPQAQRKIRAFWTALHDFLGLEHGERGELRDVISQLPGDIRELLGEDLPERRRAAG